jgi:GNAT superfamily N-acetyltransferase
MMKLIPTNTLSPEQKSAIINLWNNEYPENIAYSDPVDFDNYLAALGNPRHTLILTEDHKIIGWFVDFTREEEKWFAMIVDSSYQGKGLGSQLLTKAKEQNDELNGWATDHNNYKKRNGGVYKNPIEFYIKNGFSILSKTRLELEKLSAVKIKWRK